MNPLTCTHDKKDGRRQEGKITKKTLMNYGMIAGIVQGFFG